MFKTLIASIWAEILGFLQKNPDFFQLEESARKQRLEALKMPTPFTNYLLKTSEKALLKELSETAAALKNAKKQPSEGNAFWEAFMEFFVHSFGIRMDLFCENAKESAEYRRAVVEKLIPSDQGIGTELRKLLMRYSYQEISSELIRLSRSALGGAYLIVQSPRSMSAELKKEIRQALAEQFPTSFPVFQVNRRLIGGFRLFKEGEILDYSWISRVLRFQKLLTA